MKPERKRRRSRLGIRWKVFGFMMLFILLLLIVLWLFQVVFFGRIYRAVRISEIKNAADVLEDNISSEIGNLRSAAREISESRQMCVLVVDSSGNILVSQDTVGECLIHTMSGKNVFKLFSIAENGGEAMMSFELDMFKRLPPERPDRDFGPPEIREKHENSTESIIYTRLVETDDSDRDLMIDSFFDSGDTNITKAAT